MRGRKAGHSHAKKTSTEAPAPGLRGRIWIDGPDGTFIGYGRVVLLERIMQYGSITKAAKSMEMAYRHAWDLVDSMNRQSEKPFVELSTGGKGGGGARVTEEGELAVRLFWKFHEDFQKFLKEEGKRVMTLRASLMRAEELSFSRKREPRNAKKPRDSGSKHKSLLSRLH